MQYLKQKKAQLAALGKWKHINCLRRNAREEIQDALLRKLVYVSPEDDAQEEEEAGPKSLLDTVHLENLMRETRPPLAIDQVPGGSVSFLFERSSETSLEAEDVDADKQP
jgi:DNA repair and recombination protein RAD54B